MSIEVKVPVLPESVADATVAQWYKKIGDPVRRNENLVDLETDKVMLEVPALVDGILKDIKKPEGSTVTANEVIAIIAEAATTGETTHSASVEKMPKPEAQEIKAPLLSPAVRRLMNERDLDAAQIKGSGKDSRITKTDVQQFIEGMDQSTSTASTIINDRHEERVPMSRLRARVAERLVEVKQTTAMLTTFNEINMQLVMDMRKRYKEEFEKTHSVRLGFMSFFVKATVEALKRFPAVNASIDGNDIVYHNYFDVGIAVSTPRGLVVPILRNAETMSMADIEKTILAYATKAKENKLSMEEMTGGTFTITNGGIFGSMLSMPILNPPQSAILGMHNIVERPIVEKGEIVVRPIMYVALSYDHRIIDGRESVSFLIAIKQALEDPARSILEL